MAPILGIIASGQIASNLTSFDSIATVTVGSGGSSTISFTSIPGTYKHLQVRGIGRTNRADVLDYYKIQFNTDTGSNYAWHQLYGSGETVGAQAGTTATEIRAFRVAGANDAANIFGGQVFDVLDYANTNKYKTVRGISGAHWNTSGASEFSSGLWRNTAAITSVTVFGQNGNFGTNSTFALYGIKA